MNELVEESMKTRKIDKDSARLFCMIRLVTMEGVIVDIDIANDLPCLVADFALGDASRNLTDQVDVCITRPLVSTFNRWLNERAQKLQELQDPETISAAAFPPNREASGLPMLEGQDD